MQDLGWQALWRARRDFTVLDTHFGCGQQFLATWQTWLQDPEAPRSLTYVALAGTDADANGFLTRQALQQQLQAPGADGVSSTSSLMVPLAEQLVAAWPVPTRNIHCLDFESGRLRLLLAVGPAASLLKQLRLRADVAWVPSQAAMTSASSAQRVASALARLMKVGGSLDIEDGSSPWWEALRAKGFHNAEDRPSLGPSKVSRSVYRPHFPVKRSLPGVRLPEREATVVVVGGGLAGALTARAIARRGWRCLVLDKHGEPAAEASGNPAGLFHASAHPGDGLHARFSRAAALVATQLYARWIEAGRIEGAAHGVLRTRSAGQAPAELPASFVRALTAEEAQALSGCAIDAAWWYAQGGWVSPADVCRTALQTPLVTWQGETQIHGLERTGSGWRVLDQRGQTLVETPVVVCATGISPLAVPQAEPLPVTPVRGQVSWLDAHGAPETSNLPMLPLTGHGYALRLTNGTLCFGATSQERDLEPTTRWEDHRYNCERLEALCGIRAPSDGMLRGRVGWRSTAPDRLPLVGAWPVSTDPGSAPGSWDQCRRVPRLPGLFVLTGLASRGLTWAPLAAEVIAAAISDQPQPLEADLLDAIDPARTLVRSMRHMARHQR